MLRRNRRSFTWLVGLTLAALVALPTAAFANTSGQIAKTGGMTAVVPLLGGGLTVEVTLDVVGNITNVNLDPVTVDPGGAFAANRVGPHAVSFETADGTVQVKIKASGNKMSLKASASSLESLTGPGTWTADVFGTGAATVAYTIGANPDGSPTLVIGAVSAPSGVTVDQQPVETKTDDDGSSASARIDFSLGGLVAHLKIRVSVGNEGDRPARLKIELSAKDRQKLAGSLDSLLGPHAWTGFLCDGTAVAVNFVVNDDGTATFVDATGAPATAEDAEHGFKVRFDGTKTRIRVKLAEGEDGDWTLRVDAKTDKCKDEPAVPPTVNTPVQEGAVRSDHHGDSDKHGDGDEHSDSGGDRKGDSARNGDSDRHGDSSRKDGETEDH